MGSGAWSVERVEVAKIKAKCEDLHAVVTWLQHFVGQLGSRDWVRNLVITVLLKEEAIHGAVNNPFQVS